MPDSTLDGRTTFGYGAFLFCEEQFCACFARSNLYSAKEKLEIVNVLGFAFHFARPPIPSPSKADEGRIPFELFLEYTAS
ncbi:MAG: hypothetical protein HYW15_03110 [Candidatus Giovannonibacteria bacterium]|nr:MAG: hypothetical protein HYW15_03110 [Candidatus Giovannonibacteria bacterium]